MLRKMYRWKWPITLYMQVVIFYCMISSCFAKFQYTFTKHPMHAAVTEGETVSLQCEWEPDLLPGYNLRWSHYKGSTFYKYIEESSDTKYMLLNETNSSTLLIPSFSGSDVGGYRCELHERKSVTYSTAAEVSLLICDPETDEGDLGSILECYSTSDFVDLQWFRNGEPFDETQLMTLSREDDGVEFTCRAMYNSLEIGRCTTTPLILTIYARIEKNPPGSIQVGDKFTLTCLVSGDPDRYDYLWMFGSIIVYGSTKKSYQLGDKENVLAFSDVISNYNGSNTSCTVSRPNRNSAVAFFIIDLPTTNDNIDAITSLFSETITPSLVSHTYRPSQNKSSITSNPLSIVAITLAIFISISIIFIVIYHKKLRIIGSNTRNASNRRLDNIDGEYDDVALPRSHSTEIATEDNGEHNIVELNTLYGQTY